MHPRSMTFSVLSLTAVVAGVCPEIATHPTLSGIAAPGDAVHAEPVSTSEWARTQLGFEPSARQAEVLDAGAKYLMLCCNRQWGKTTTIAVKVLHHALRVPNQSIVIISRTKLQAGILIEKANDFAIALGHRTRRVLGHQYSLKFPNGSRIVAVPHTQDTSLGRTAHVLVVDEAAQVKDEVYFAVSPFVARTHGAIWLLSTPSRQAGFFYNYWHDQASRWHRVFSNIDDCPEIDPDFLDMQRRADPVKYRQDFLCEFVQPANRLCTREFVRSILRKKE